MRQNVWAKCMRAAGKHLTKDLVKVSLGVLLRRCPFLQFLLVPGVHTMSACAHTLSSDVWEVLQMQVQVHK